MTAPHRLAAVLFDRDGTLVVDVPYCADPSRVRPMPAARPALRRLRAAGIRTGVVTNQSGIGRGILTDGRGGGRERRGRAPARPVRRLADLPARPRRRLPRAASRARTCCSTRRAELGVEPHRIAFVGDIGSDVEAAQAAGAASVLVPTSVTRPAEIRAAPVVRRTLTEAVDHLLDEVGRSDGVRVRRVLVVRLDGAGDVLLAGPAVRAVAAGSEVTMLCGPDGAAAARLLPGVADVLTLGEPLGARRPAPGARGRPRPARGPPGRLAVRRGRGADLVPPVAAAHRPRAAAGRASPGSRAPRSTTPAPCSTSACAPGRTCPRTSPSPNA